VNARNQRRSPIKSISIKGWVAQLAEQWTENPLCYPRSNYRLSRICEHWRHKAAILDAHNVNTPSMVAFNVVRPCALQVCFTAMHRELLVSVRLQLCIRKLSNAQPIPIPSGPLLQTASGSNTLSSAGPEVRGPELQSVRARPKPKALPIHPWPRSFRPVGVEPVRGRGGSPLEWIGHPTRKKSLGLHPLPRSFRTQGHKVVFVEGHQQVVGSNPTAGSSQLFIADRGFRVC
jgi:hypothetical protein